MTVSRLFFDESGNSGNDLLNREQPIYVLCSTDIPNETARSLLNTYFSEPETLHFKKRKRNGAGRIELVRFFREQTAALNPKFRSVVFHKEYMVICQILNYLVEPQLHRDGIDYYDRGMNVAHANMMYCVLPAFCGAGPTRRFYQSFIDMMRIRSPDSIEKFFSSIGQLKRHCVNDDFQTDLHILERSIQDVATVLAATDKYAIDPSMHALIELCALWTESYPEGYDVVHDRSNSINNQKHHLDFLANMESEPTWVGYGQRKMKLPFPIRSVTFESAEVNPSIRLADLFCSGLFHIHKTERNDPFTESIAEHLVHWSFSDMVSPSTDVDVMADRIKQPGDIDVLDFIAKHIAQKTNGPNGKSGPNAG